MELPVVGWWLFMGLIVDWWLLMELLLVGRWLMIDW
jgi:hypothetical protein